MRLLRSGEYEPLKAGVHAVACGVLGVCAIYSISALIARRVRTGHWQRHLAGNAVLYTAGTWWEAQQVKHHLEVHRE